MSEAEQILADATAKADARSRSYTPVDYAALNAMVKRQRAALTRAVNSKDVNKVLVVCRDAVREWRKPGSMWPDDWSRWERALNDMLPWHKQVSLEDLD